MKKNSIEEDIKKIEIYLANSAINETNSNFFKNGGWETVDLEIPKAMQHILADYKKVLKENEELLEVKVSASAHNRILELEKENKQLKNTIAIADKLEERIKENFVPKEKIETIIKKINVYKKLAKESMEQEIVIADNDSLEYGRMQAHNLDMSMLQDL